MSMGETSVDNLSPDFKAQIAECVDQIIAAASPGKPLVEPAQPPAGPHHPVMEALEDMRETRRARRSRIEGNPETER